MRLEQLRYIVESQIRRHQEVMKSYTGMTAENKAYFEGEINAYAYVMAFMDDMLDKKGGEECHE